MIDINHTNKFIKKTISKKLSFLFILIITLLVLSACSLNKNIKVQNEIFCSCSPSPSLDNFKGFFIVKLDSNTIELEEFIYIVGIRQHYGKGKLSHVSKNKITFVCDPIIFQDSIKYHYPYTDLRPVFNWRAHEYDYIKIISNKELIYFMKNEKKYKKIILRSDSCDYIRELEEWSVIMNPKLTPILNF